MSFIVRFLTRVDTESELLQLALWVKNTLGAKVTGAGGSSKGDFTFNTADTTFNDMVDTIQTVKAQVPKINYNFEME